MSTPLNLTLQRGPSVWESQRQWPSKWRVYGVTAGALLATVAMRPQVKRSWLLGLAIGIAGTSLLAGRISTTVEVGKHRWRVRRSDDAVDRASEASFPASDPPQY